MHLVKCGGVAGDDGGDSGSHVLCDRREGEVDAERRTEASAREEFIGGRRSSQKNIIECGKRQCVRVKIRAKGLGAYNEESVAIEEEEKNESLVNKYRPGEGMVVLDVLSGTGMMTSVYQPGLEKPTLRESSKSQSAAGSTSRSQSR
jgi:hypothetical protein